MTKERPNSVVVIAILNFIGGGLGVLGGILALIGALLIGTQMFKFPAGPPPAGQPKQMQEYLEINERIMEVATNPPGGMALGVVHALADLALSGLIIAAGIGLLRLAPWGRNLALGYAIYSILFHLYQAFYVIWFMIPPYLPVLRGAPKGNFLVDIMVWSTYGQTYGVAVYQFLILSYPIVVLVIMFRPNVVAAFRGEGPTLVVPESWGRPVGELTDPQERDDRLRPGERSEV